MEKQGLAFLERPKALPCQRQALEQEGSTFSSQLEQDWVPALAFLMGQKFLILG
jgi:hypothetical protein